MTIWDKVLHYFYVASREKMSFVKRLARNVVYKTSKNNRINNCLISFATKSLFFSPSVVRFAQLVGKNSSVTYVANVSDFIASAPGLNTKNVVQVKRNPNNSPYPTKSNF